MMIDDEGVSSPAVVSVTRLGLGRDKRTFQVAASMARRGFRSAVVEGELSTLDREGLPFDLITVEGAEPLREPDTGFEPGVPKKGSLVSRLLAPRTLRRLFLADNELTYRALPDADLYYLTFFWQYPAVWRKCRENGARFVYDANDAYWLWPGYAWYPRLFRAYLRLVERRCVRRAAGFVTVSEGVADLLQERYGRRPDVVRNMHDLRMDEESEVDVRDVAGLADDDFAVVIVGNEKPSDAVEEPIRALAELPDRVHLVCLGAGYDQHLPLARELGLSDRVHLVSPVPPVHVTSAIHSADACLVNIRSSDVHRFALPTRFFSAVAAGLPVLHPPLPEVRALATEYGLGPAVDAEDPASVAAGVREMLEPGAEEACRERVGRARQVLSWEHEENVLARIVDEALAG